MERSFKFDEFVMLPLLFTVGCDLDPYPRRCSKPLRQSQPEEETARKTEESQPRKFKQPNPVKKRSIFVLNCPW